MSPAEKRLRTVMWRLVHHARSVLDDAREAYGDDYWSDSSYRATRARHRQFENAVDAAYDILTEKPGDRYAS